MRCFARHEQNMGERRQERARYTLLSDPSERSEARVQRGKPIAIVGGAQRTFFIFHCHFPRSFF